jgi:dolichol-phosphate mannosyltransferase
MDVLRASASNDRRIKVIDLKKNYGQTAAINAGIQNAKGDIIVLMDSDLENLPSDIPMMVDKLNEGYDVVSGWRKARWEGQFLTRKLPSLMANSIISKISSVKLHDYGCTLKVYRADVLSEVRLYGQMHRFIPVYCKWQGGRVTEVAVNYQPRKFGKSNYGISRTYKVILDLILIKFLEKYMQRPIHFFGGIGFLSFFAGIATFGLATYFKVTGQKDFVETPLPVFTMMFFTIGVLMILLGVVAEVLMRTYFESQNKFPFSIKSKININE